jgi:hypothetical protein
MVSTIRLNWQEQSAMSSTGKLSICAADLLYFEHTCPASIDRIARQFPDFNIA